MPTRTANRPPAFIATVDASVSATGKPIDRSHWPVQARNLDEAKTIAQQQSDNTNRTIPSVTNKIVIVEPFNRDICLFFQRGLTCQGHDLELTPLKQEHGGHK